MCSLSIRVPPKYSPAVPSISPILHLWWPLSDDLVDLPQEPVGADLVRGPKQRPTDANGHSPGAAERPDGVYRRDCSSFLRERHKTVLARSREHLRDGGPGGRPWRSSDSTAEVHVSRARVGTGQLALAGAGRPVIATSVCRPERVRLSVPQPSTESVAKIDVYEGRAAREGDIVQPRDGRDAPLP